MNIYRTGLFPHIIGDSLVGKTATLTMTEVKVERLTGHEGRSEEKFVLFLFFEETEKCLILNKTNAATIAKLYGPETDDWRGQAITLYSEEIRAFGKTHNAVRVAPAQPAAEESGQQPPLMELTDPQKRALIYMLENTTGNEWLQDTPARHNVMVNLKEKGLINYALDPDKGWIERLTEQGKAVAVELMSERRG